MVKKHTLKPNPAVFDEELFKRAQALKLCGVCNIERVPEGGVQVTASKWVCYKCWPNYVRKRMAKAKIR